MREIPFEDKRPNIPFAERLFAGDFDMMVFLTGAGARFSIGVSADQSDF